MSLINEALKKAQKLRTEEPAGIATSVLGSGTRVEKRAEPRSAQQLVLIVAGGVVLVVLSVVVTFWFVNRTPAAKPAPKPVAVKPADASAPSPTIVAPAIKPPVVAAESPPTAPGARPAGVEKSAPATPTATAPPPAPASSLSANVVEAPAPAAIAAATPPPTQPPAVATAAAAPSPENPSAVQPVAAAPIAVAGPIATDPRVHAFVDAVKVMGIRSVAGGDSRVLMNDRVFRVNDIVERTLGVRLTKVEPATLTFTDANGAIYTKNF